MSLTHKNDNTCAHPGCTCAPRSGSKYCSPYCDDAGDTIELTCSCGHPGCGAIGVRADDDVVVAHELRADDDELMPETA